MNAYVCVYRQIEPAPGDLKKTKENAERDPLLGKFLAEYGKSFYDWGDDPSFFSAKERLGDVRKATWGVCRRDVRASLDEGDVVVFFCGSQSKRKGCWWYYFVGFGTVLEIVKPRRQLWTIRKFAPYRKFYNLLTGPDDKQREVFHPFHNDDWAERAKDPYILFDSARSAFNIVSPHPVAAWNREGKEETWNRDRRAREIERLLFTERGIERRLRTSNTGYAHVKLNLLRDGSRDRPGRSLADLTKALERLV